MKLYPCTKQPPCTKVRGHRTPVCPNDTSKNTASVSKLKTEAMLEHEPARISYHDNGKVSYEEWEPGKGPEGLWLCRYDDSGHIIGEYWEAGGNYNGLISRKYENQVLVEEQWYPGKGPRELLYRAYDVHGNVIEEY